MNFSMSAFLFRNISSRAGLTRKARAEVVAPTASMQSIASINFAICGFASFKRRLNISIAMLSKESERKEKIQHLF
jgi:hypothetical protein